MTEKINLLCIWGATALLVFMTTACSDEKADPCDGLSHFDLLHFEASTEAAEFEEISACVVSIDGELYLDQVAVSSASFPRLQSVGRLRIQGGDALQTIDFPVLSAVPQGITVQAMRSLTRLSFPALESLSGCEDCVPDPPYGISIIDNTALVELELSAAISLGRLYITENDRLETVRAPVLRTVTGSYVTEGCDAFEHGFEVSLNPALSTLELPALKEVTDGRFVLKNSALTSLSLPVFMAVGHHFSILENPQLTSIDVPVFADAGLLWIQNNPRLPQSDVDALAVQLGIECAGMAYCEGPTTCDGNLND